MSQRGQGAVSARLLRSQETLFADFHFQAKQCRRKPAAIAELDGWQATSMLNDLLTYLEEIEIYNIYYTFTLGAC